MSELQDWKLHLQLLHVLNRSCVFAYIPKVSQAAMDTLPCYSALHSTDLGSGGDEDPLLGLQPLAPLPRLGKLLLAKHSSQGVELL